MFWRLLDNTILSFDNANPESQEIDGRLIILPRYSDIFGILFFCWLHHFTKSLYSGSVIFKIKNQTNVHWPFIYNAFLDTYSNL